MKKTTRNRWDRNTESVDDYLKAIYSLSGDERRWVGGSELATRLQIAPASVTNMLQKLSGEAKSITNEAPACGFRLLAEDERLRSFVITGS